MFSKITSIFIVFFKSFSPEMWKGAMLGVIVSAAFGACVATIRQLLKLSPIKRFLGGFANNKDDCAIFVKSVITEGQILRSRVPDYFPPHTSGRTVCWQNIPHVVPTSDMRAATDFLNLIGQAGKKDNIDFYSIADQWNVWDKNLVSIGGNTKTDRIFDIDEMISFENNSVFIFDNTDKHFVPIDGHDYGLIYKNFYPTTGKICIVIMGFGVVGTEAAAYFLRRHAASLGKMFGNRKFAFLLKVRLDEGKDSARPLWFSPEPPIWRKLLHPITWFKQIKPFRDEEA